MQVSRKMKLSNLHTSKTRWNKSRKITYAYTSWIMSSCMISFVLREHEFELGMIGSCVHTNDLLLTILHDHFRYAYNFWMGLNVTLELKCAHTPNFILCNIFNIALFRPHAIMNRQRSNQYFLHKSCILLLCDIHIWLSNI